MNTGVAKTLVLISGSVLVIALGRAIPSVLLPAREIVLNPETPRPVVKPVSPTPTASPLAQIKFVEPPLVAKTPPKTALAENATALFVPSESPDEVDRRLQMLAESLNASTAPSYAKTAIDAAKSPDERFLATYVLSQRPTVFARELTQIAVARPTSARDTATQIQAMLALEAGKTDAAIFRQILKTHRNPLLITVARLGIRGAHDGRPLIRNYVDMKMSEILDAVN